MCCKLISDGSHQITTATLNLQNASTQVRNWDTFKGLSVVALVPGSHRDCQQGNWWCKQKHLPTAGCQFWCKQNQLDPFRTMLDFIRLLLVEIQEKWRDYFFPVLDQSRCRWFQEFCSNNTASRTSGPEFSVLAWQNCHLVCDKFRWLHSLTFEIYLQFFRLTSGSDIEHFIMYWCQFANYRK